MVKTFYGILISILVMVFGLLMMGEVDASADAIYQQPTVSVPTVTGTPTGPSIRVNADNDQINVRSGPGTQDYAVIGVLIAGQVVPAYGRSSGGDWIQVQYLGVEGGVGWVYSNLVTVLNNISLPILEPPPTSTPRVTPTINPTMAAQFIEEPAETRLPTFTAPAPLVIPTFEPAPTSSVNLGIPVGMIIVILGIIGLLGSFFSLLRGR
jgi:hypothetical protein